MLLVVGVSIIGSAAFTRTVRAYAIRTGVIDRPNLRSSHTTPTPRGGGLAVIAAFLLGMVIAVVLNLVAAKDALTLSVGVTAVGGVGWIDDTRAVRPLLRLAVHFAVAAWTVFMFGGLPSIDLGNASFGLGRGGYLLGILGIVWSVNLFNFMDGLDGLAASQAVLVLGIGAVLLFWRSNQSLGVIAAAGAASSLGFLAWNWPPAKIFLGDTGSGAIGYLVAGIAIASENSHSAPLLAFGIVSGLFIADATVTLLRRVVRGEGIAEAHRDHAYQRLAQALGSHRAVTCRAIAVTAMLGALAAIGTLAPHLLFPVACAAGLLLACVLWFVEHSAPMRGRIRV